MKILITGANGQLGNEIIDILKAGKSELGLLPEELINSEVYGYDVDTLDITKIEAVRGVLLKVRPDIVINCAAYTNVDGCEDNIEAAFKVNGLGARNLAMVSNEIGAKLLQVSTDYVFSGNGNIPFKEYDIAAPYSVYGKTKLAGESFVKEMTLKYFIIRTAWLYGKRGNNFVYTMMKLGKEKEELNVVNDQVGNPTNAHDLAHHILMLSLTEEYGVYHCTNNEECSWYDFAVKIMELNNIQCKVNPCTSDEFKRKAKRPEYSSLDNLMLRCTIGDNMRCWEEALESFVKSINN